MIWSQEFFRNMSWEEPRKGGGEGPWEWEELRDERAVGGVPRAYGYGEARSSESRLRMKEL